MIINPQTDSFHFGLTNKQTFDIKKSSTVKIKRLISNSRENFNFYSKTCLIAHILATNKHKQNQKEKLK